MDEALARQLLRQMKIIKRLLTFFTLLFIASLIAGGIVLYKVVTFVNQTSKQINDFQQAAGQNVDLKGQLCNNPSITAYLPDKSTLCQQQ